MVMDVAVDKIGGSGSFYKIVEASETTMAEVFRITNVAWRSMGNNDIKTPNDNKLKPQLSDLATHLVLMVLIWIAVIPPGAGEPEKSKSFESDDSAAYIGTSGDWSFMANIMVAKNVKKRCLITVAKPLKILGGEVPTGEDQAYFLVLIEEGRFEQFRKNNIRYA